MPVDAGVLDANVLVYAFDATTVQHSPSRKLLEAARQPGTVLYVTAQILCEFYAIVTDGRRVRSPRSPSDAVSAIASALSLPGIQMLPMPADTIRRLIALVGRRPVTRGAIFDLQIIATMQANNVQRIYTFNTSDFDVFSELTVVSPDAVTL